MNISEIFKSFLILAKIDLGPNFVYRGNPDGSEGIQLVPIVPNKSELGTHQKLRRNLSAYGRLKNHDRNKNSERNKQLDLNEPHNKIDRMVSTYVLKIPYYIEGHSIMCKSIWLVADQLNQPIRDLVFNWSCPYVCIFNTGKSSTNFSSQCSKTFINNLLLKSKYVHSTLSRNEMFVLDEIDLAKCF